MSKELTPYFLVIDYDKFERFVHLEHKYYLTAITLIWYAFHVLIPGSACYAFTRIYIKPGPEILTPMYKVHDCNICAACRSVARNTSKIGLRNQPMLKPLYIKAG